MDKRLIIVFLVVVLVVLGYQMFYYSPKMKDHQAQVLIEEARLAATQDSLARVAATAERFRQETEPPWSWNHSKSFKSFTS